MSDFLKDRYCTCKTLCVWIPMDGPPRVWSVSPRAYQAYCPTCKIIVNEYIEKDENNALMLTPKVSFAIFKENENLQAALAEKDARIEELEAALKNIKKHYCTECAASRFAKEALEARDE